MMQQYLSIKERYADAILFFRMGDFYEMFFEDALTASKILEITLTSRNKKDGSEVQVPMCGVPVRAAQGYIARLISGGHKVAVCEQTQDPASATGLVEREVVRVITPGMIVEDEFLDERSSNYILAAARHGDRAGVAWLDISTGTFRVFETAAGRTLEEEIRRIGPRELLLPEGAKDGDDPLLVSVRAAVDGASVSRWPDRFFEPRAAYEQLTGQMGTVSLEGFGCEEMTAAIRAAGALVHYVRETQKRAVGQLTRIETHAPARYLTIDEVSARNLELFRNIRSGSRKGTLLSVIDRTITAMGARRMKEWLQYPLVSAEAIRSRQDAVAAALENPSARKTLRELLSDIHDLERLGSKAVMGHATPRDFTGLKRSLGRLPEIIEALADLPAELFRVDIEVAPLTALADHIHRAIREDAPPTVSEGGIICPGYSQELDELVRIGADGKGALAQMEARERKATGIQTLKVRYNKVFGYYIEIPKRRLDEVPDHYIRKQTLVNAERYITDELKSFESKVLGAQEERASLEYALFEEVREAVSAETTRLQAAARFLARLDCILALAQGAEADGYSRPEIVTSGELIIEDGRHPVVEKLMTGERFIPNTVRMDHRDSQVLIITGPNMAGKSTVLRQVALTVLMAQMGAFVPAARAVVSVTDRIFTRVGALDNLSGGQSTFMVEMQETANILNNASPESLVILDEIGRGTSTFDGLSIAWSVAEYLHDLRGKGVKTLFATHYHELIALADRKPRIRNLSIAVKEWKGEIIFLRKLVAGGTSRSYGIQVARLAGIPAGVIERAGEVLRRIEAEGTPAVAINAVADAPSGGEYVQMNLFGGPDREVVEALMGIDLDRMTPIDALNRLYALREKAGRIR